MGMKRESLQGVASVIPAYVALLALPPELHERRRPLIAEVVQECDTRYRGLFYAVIRAMGMRRDEADDIVQDTLLHWRQRLENRQKLPPPEALTTYLKTIARNAAMRHMRRERKRKLVENESARRRFGAEQCTELDDLDLKELRKVIRRIAKDRLTPRMRKVLYLRWQGRTYQEIADLLNEKSAERVRGVMRYVLRILWKELPPFGWGI